MTSGLGFQVLETKGRVASGQLASSGSAHIRKLQVGAVHGGGGRTVALRSPLHTPQEEGLAHRHPESTNHKSNKHIPAPSLSSPPVPVLEKSEASLWLRWGDRSKSDHTSLPLCSADPKVGSLYWMPARSFDVK